MPYSNCKPFRNDLLPSGLNINLFNTGKISLVGFLRWFYDKWNQTIYLTKHRQTSNWSHTLVYNKIVDHSDVVRASPVGACRRCSSYIFILAVTLGFSELGKENCKTKQETFKFCDLVRLILEVWRYTSYRKQGILDPLRVESRAKDIRFVCTNFYVHVSHAGPTVQRITAMPYVGVGVSNHRSFDWMFKSMFGITPRRKLKVRIIGP